MRSASSGNGSTSGSANRHYMAIHQYPPHTIQTLPNGSRTPVAWQNRDTNLSRPPSSIHNHHNHHYIPHHHNYRRSGRPSSPSVTTTSSDDREEVPMMRHPHRRPNSRITGNGAIQTVDRRSIYSQQNHSSCIPYNGTLLPGEYAAGCHGGRGLRTGTLRSTKSVPALAMATWDGEPCPIHGNGFPQCYPCLAQMVPPPNPMRRFGSVMDVRNDKKFSGSLMPVFCGPPQMSPPMSPLPPPSIPLQIITSKYNQRPMVFPAFSERDPFKISSPVPSSHKFVNHNDYDDDVCCKGHLVVLWIILGVVTVGVISGIILAVTMN